MATTMTKGTIGARTAGPSKQYLKRGGKVKKSLPKAQEGITVKTKSQRLADKAFDLYEKAENSDKSAKRKERMIERGERIYQRGVNARRKERAEGIYKKGGMTKSKKK